MDASLLWYAFAVHAGLELLLYILPFWWRATILRRLYASGLTVALGFLMGALLILRLDFIMVLVVFFGLYRTVNLLRIIENRSHLRHQRKVAARTGVLLLGCQLMLFGIGWLMQHVSIVYDAWMYALAAAQLAVAVVLYASTIRRLQRTTLHATKEAFAASELPTVTVAIPARNETESLEHCLKSLVHNTYPKLEILVLDDCSQTRKTPEIISSFAHDGVRFLKGEVPAENWLAKNQAYHKLAHEANGEIILFCGVDTRFERDTVLKLVMELLSRNKRMISVIPYRKQPPKAYQSFIQAGRYLWELTPPRRLFRRPPVISSCWLIYRKDLLGLGGFKAVSRMILPEAYFARQNLNGDGYSFLRGTESLGLFSAKGPDEQRQTAIRTRYPQLHRRPENVAVLTLLEVLLLLGPFALIVFAVFGYAPLLSGLAALISAGLLIASHYLVTTRTNLQRPLTALWSMPAVVVSDIGLMHVSLQQYEFSEVLWKGRNVCVPVMHVIPSLPKA